MNAKILGWGSRVLAAMCLLALLGGMVNQSGKVAAQNVPETSLSGAWLDSVVFSEADEVTGVAQLAANQLDLYDSYGSTNPGLYQDVLNNSELTYSFSKGVYYELTFNPYGPMFNDGRLNPFSNTAIREAINYLVDRQWIIQNILGGLGRPKFLPITTDFPEYQRYRSTAQALEAQYAYDLPHAQAVIATEMTAMGAVLNGGVWNYNGEPISIIFLIRIEDERLAIGDYVADQLQAVGFAVDRQYKTRSEASPIWSQSDPAEGLWHLYTGGWITTNVERDEGANFSFFYTPHDYPIPLHQAYQPSPEFDALTLQLRDHDFASWDERDVLFQQALADSLNDPGVGSVRVWLVNRNGFTPRRMGSVVSYNKAGGVLASDLWPYVARFDGVVGGQLRVAQPGLYLGPWNPLDGSSWVYDSGVQRATRDNAFVYDPYSGLIWPQRAERAEVIVQTGLPVSKTLDWVTLSFQPQIDVPGDAWVDWDAAQQRFITAAEKYPGGSTALVKSTVYYPADLYTTAKWHDGSPVDDSDFVMKMILTFDRGKPNSLLYDQDAEAALDSFLAHFKGVRIVSTQPLVIETYEDLYQLDAELNVVSWWPLYNTGEAPWHTLAIGVRAELANQLAFGYGKSDMLMVPQIDFIGGESLPILQTHLNAAAASQYLPYASVLGAYISPAQVSARWANLQSWFGARGHFWVGSGPFYLSSLTLSPKTMTLTRTATFPDPAGKWDRFAYIDSCQAVTEIPQTECEALAALFEQTGGPGWSNPQNWMKNHRPSTWAGVVVQGGHVFILDLRDQRLSGPLPQELGNLSNVWALVLAENNLSGNIPPELGNLTNVEWFDLSYNNLSGLIPDELGNLTHAKGIYLAANQLSGAIPITLDGDLNQLMHLELYSNQLTGNIPTQLGSCTTLERLWLYNNALSGDVPVSFLNLISLEDQVGLDLGYNRLTVPASPPELEAFLQLKDQNWPYTQAVSEQFASGESGTLNARDGQTEMQIPAGATQNGLSLLYAPHKQPAFSHPKLATERNFLLSAEDGNGDPISDFAAPLMVTIFYSDEDAGTLITEKKLRLYWWNVATQTWDDALTTCESGTYERNTAENWLRLPICKTGEFALLRDYHTLYLPSLGR